MPKVWLLMLPPLLLEPPPVQWPCCCPCVPGSKAPSQPNSLAAGLLSPLLLPPSSAFSWPCCCRPRAHRCPQGHPAAAGRAGLEHPHVYHSLHLPLAPSSQGVCACVCVWMRFNVCAKVCTGEYECLCARMCRCVVCTYDLSNL